MFESIDDLASTPPHEHALDCLQAGIEAVQPARAVDRHCSVTNGTLRIRDSEYDLSAYDSVRIVGGGKAADGLAAALESLLGEQLTGGVVVTDEHTAETERVSVRIGDHPVPTEASVRGTTRVLEAARNATDRTLLIAPITGGGSALLCAPPSGLSVDDIRSVTEQLLDAGASIDETNTVRRICSRIKGGGLARVAQPARTVGILLSDVVGDDPSVIASGPTTPSDTGAEDALEILDRYDLNAPAVREWLRTVDPDSSAAIEPDNHVIAAGRDAIDAARQTATDHGYETCVLSAGIEGDAAAAGRFHAAIGTEAVTTGDPVAPPAVILSGGETTVRVTGGGTGGPNQEFALAAASGLPHRVVLGAVDTDGRDGSTDAAGALVDGRTVSESDADAARAALDDNDSYGFLDPKGRLLRSGATGTNVNDLRVIVVPTE